MEPSQLGVAIACLDEVRQILGTDSDDDDAVGMRAVALLDVNERLGEAAGRDEETKSAPSEPPLELAPERIELGASDAACRWDLGIRWG
jgi:hypothetical protein